MFRLFRGSVEQIITALLHYRDLGYYGGDAHAHANKHYTHKTTQNKGGPLIDVVRMILNPERNKSKAMVEDEDFNHIIDVLVSQYMTEMGPGAKNQDRDLIQTIVDTLEIPYGANHLRGDALYRLRRAVLLPNELSVVRHKLEVLGCAGCSHIFVDGESVTVQKTRNELAFFCTRCIRPITQACDQDGCEEMVKMSEKLREVFGDSARCDTHSGKVKVPLTPTVGGLDGGTAAYRRHITRTANNPWRAVMENNAEQAAPQVATADNNGGWIIQPMDLNTVNIPVPPPPTPILEDEDIPFDPPEDFAPPRRRR